ncbi:hypothetical protein MmiHf6_13940 [Methanimicrococcus hongohii]|uniref:Uncharacterized protein n=1 Tax=Methanimicrococcus hongohii TaxID=3028295 RepID=A0AA96V0D5_9EURY|nr:hypothetical protein MmiHf6_13940 [Methanimicrococcus sp. Hf6]
MNKKLYIIYVSIVVILSFIFLVKGASLTTMILFMIFISFLWAVIDHKFGNV